VFELLFSKALPDAPRLKVLSALLVFRLLYLVIPLLLVIAVVIISSVASSWRVKFAVAVILPDHSFTGLRIGPDAGEGEGALMTRGLIGLRPQRDCALPGSEG